MTTKTEKIRDQLRDAIATEYHPGQPLLPERELEIRYQVSRVTIRRALDALVAEGIIYRVRGSGTYVNDQRNVRKPLSLTSFSEDMADRGLNPSSRLLSITVVSPDEVVRVELGDLSGEVLRLERLRCADDEPLAHELAFLPITRFPGIESEDFSRSLYRILEERFRVVPIRARQRMRSIPMSPTLALHLGVKEGVAAMEVLRTTFDRYGKPFEYVVSTYRGDRYEFDISVDR